MNGRLYDPLVGRFLNVDPVIQDPGYTQNYNRYSYCFNNPLKYTDLSGETVPLGMDGGGGYNDRFWERTYNFKDSGGTTYSPSERGMRAGSAGGGGNGSGDNGVYYDNFSGSYISTLTGQEVGLSGTYNAVSPYFDNDLSYSLVPYAWAKAGSSSWEPKLYRLEQTPGTDWKWVTNASIQLVGGMAEMAI